MNSNTSACRMSCKECNAIFVTGWVRASQSRACTTICSPHDATKQPAGKCSATVAALIRNAQMRAAPALGLNRRKPSARNSSEGTGAVAGSTSSAMSFGSYLASNVFAGIEYLRADWSMYLNIIRAKREGLLEEQCTKHESETIDVRRWSFMLTNAHVSSNLRGRFNAPFSARVYDDEIALGHFPRAFHNSIWEHRG